MVIRRSLVFALVIAVAVDAGLPVSAGILASALGWSYYMISPALVIIAVYLFGAAPGAAMLSGERVGLVAVDPNFAFYFSVGFLVMHMVMYWMARDMPLRIANTPLDEYIEKGPRPLEEVKKALPKGELIVPR